MKRVDRLKPFWSSEALLFLCREGWILLQRQCGSPIISNNANPINPPVHLILFTCFRENMKHFHDMTCGMFWTFVLHTDPHVEGCWAFCMQRIFQFTFDSKMSLCNSWINATSTSVKNIYSILNYSSFLRMERVQIHPFLYLFANCCCKIRYSDMLKMIWFWATFVFSKGKCCFKKKKLITFYN